MLSFPRTVLSQPAAGHIASCEQAWLGQGSWAAVQCQLHWKKLTAGECAMLSGHGDGGCLGPFLSNKNMLQIPFSPLGACHQEVWKARRGHAMAAIVSEAALEWARAPATLGVPCHTADRQTDRAAAGGQWPGGAAWDRQLLCKQSTGQCRMEPGGLTQPGQQPGLPIIAPAGAALATALGHIETRRAQVQL